MLIPFSAFLLENVLLVVIFHCHIFSTLVWVGRSAGMCLVKITCCMGLSFFNYGNVSAGLRVCERLLAQN